MSIISVALAVKDIINLVFRYVFLRIEGSLLITPAFNLRVYGAPVLIAGPVGGNAVRLNGINQWLSLTNLSSKSKIN